jgi:YHS domain-containing protein/putative intracellular protease/amidase
MKKPISRRELVQRSVQLGVAAAVPGSTWSLLSREASAQTMAGMQMSGTQPSLPVPSSGPIPVAFLMSEGAVMIDFAGAWEVFQDTPNPKTNRRAFQLYTVAEMLKPIRVSGGMKIVPDYSVTDAPLPKVLVIPAQSGESDVLLNWIRKAAKQADMTMSVCTGAFLLAKTGLLDGLGATTHHGQYKMFEVEYPKVHLQRGMRFVDEGSVASSGGLSAGIDLAFHVVERYFGRGIAQATADNMEYQGQGWLDAKSNAACAVAASSTQDHPLCPVCGMEANKDLHWEYKGKVYYFCSPDHKNAFELAPTKYLS